MGPQFYSISTYSQSPYVKKPSHHRRTGEHRKPHCRKREVHGVRRFRNLDQFDWSKSWYPNGTLSSSCLMDGSSPNHMVIRSKWNIPKWIKLGTSFQWTSHMVAVEVGPSASTACHAWFCAICWLCLVVHACSYGHLSVISTYSPIYRVYNPIYNHL